MDGQFYPTEKTISMDACQLGEIIVSLKNYDEWVKETQWDCGELGAEDYALHLKAVYYLIGRFSTGVVTEDMMLAYRGYLAEIAGEEVPDDMEAFLVREDELEAYLDDEEE